MTIAWRPKIRDGYINWSPKNQSTDTTVTLAPDAVSIKTGKTVDLQATVLTPTGPAEGLIGTVTAAPGSVATAVQVGATNASGQAVIRVTGVSAGSASVVVTFLDVASNPATVTVSVPALAELSGSALISGTAAGYLSTGLVRGVMVQLHTKGKVIRANVSDITVLWWDGNKRGAPVYEGVTATDAEGRIKVNLDAFTSLTVGKVGTIDLYKAGATPQYDLRFSSRLTVVDIS